MVLGPLSESDTEEMAGRLLNEMNHERRRLALPSLNQEIGFRIAKDAARMFLRWKDNFNLRPSVTESVFRATGVNIEGVGGNGEE